jgi:hypothetical protein
VALMAYAALAQALTWTTTNTVPVPARNPLGFVHDKYVRVSGNKRTTLAPSLAFLPALQQTVGKGDCISRGDTLI